MRILIIEDEIELQEAIRDGLTIDGYAVDTCDNGEDGYELLSIENYDLAILDLNLPKMNGLEVLRKIRKEKTDLKIIILSARNQVEDKVNGLDFGANDYLSKPFSFSELEARIRNLLRRKFSQEQPCLLYGDLRIDLSLRSVYIKNVPLHLSRKEFSILEYLFLNRERIISQEELIDHVWNASIDSFSGSIRVHISALRKKTKAELGIDPIGTKIGEGYFIIEENGDSHDT